MSMQVATLLTTHSLFVRDKWTQEPVPDHGKNKRKARFQNFDLSYKFGGEEGKYDVKVGVRRRR